MHLLYIITIKQELQLPSSYIILYSCSLQSATAPCLLYWVSWHEECLIL